MRAQLHRGQHADVVLGRRGPISPAALRSDEGQGLIELMIAMFILAIALSAIFALMTSGALSLQRAGEKGTALTLAEQQMEIYRTVDYADIRLSASALSAVPAEYTSNAPTSTTACLSNLLSTGTPPGCLVVDTLTGATKSSCTSVPTTFPDPCAPAQAISGSTTPDHRAYEVDTYITYLTPTGVATGRQIEQVYIAVRDPNNNYATLATDVSSFDQSTNATS